MTMGRINLGIITIITAILQGSWGSESTSLIAFKKFAGGPLFVMDVDGRNQRQVTAQIASEPAWSPDGTRLAFTRSEAIDKISIYTIQREGVGETKIAEGLFPSWSPDGQQLAYSRIRADQVTADLYVLDMATGEEVRVTQGLYPSWSPTGDRIVYSNGGLSQQGAVDASTRVYSIDVNGSDQKELATGFMPSWSPQGSLILFMKIDGGPLFGDTSSVSVYGMDENGEGQVQLVAGVAATGAVSFGLTGSGSWAPDGERFAVARMEAGEADRINTFIYIFDKDGSNSVKLTEGIYPVWSPLLAAKTHTPNSTWGQIKSGGR